MFDYVISLGDNCEAGLVLRYAEIESSSLFRFTYSNIDIINNILENQFQDLYLLENLVPSYKTMVTDNRYGIWFHTGMLSIWDGSQWCFELNENERNIIYENEFEKYQYLIQKWKNQRETGKILYIIKSSKNSLNEENINRLLRNLNKMGHQRDYKLLILLEKNSSFDFVNKQVFIRKVQRFAPIQDAFDFHLKSWNSILREIYSIQLNYIKVDLHKGIKS